MRTHLVVDEVTPLPDGTFMVRGTRTEGPCLKVGQRGESASDGGCLSVEVVGTGVVNPNLDSTGRQGLLLKLTEGDVASLRGLTLIFTPLLPPTSEAPLA
jgi:hypothetical protein